MIPKFRAWDKKCNEMFKDTFAITESGQVIIVEQKSVFDAPDYVFTDDLIIMQSTGLFDKNGNEIFEGDIVRISMRIGKRTTTSIGTVEFDKFEVCFIIQNELGGHYVTMFHVRYFEVIGNIYENPELLEG